MMSTLKWRKSFKLYFMDQLCQALQGYDINLGFPEYLCFSSNLHFQTIKPSDAEPLNIQNQF